MLKHKIDGALSPLARFLHPPKCVLCGRLMEDPSLDICSECRTSAAVFMHYPWKIPYVKEWTALWQYHLDVRDAIIRFKFYHRKAYGTVFGRELGKRLKEKNIPFDVVTWVPISFLRRVARGYDQMELVTKEAAYQLGTEAVQTLHKHRHNRKQSSLRRPDDRVKNVKGVYRAVNADLFRGKRVLLMDDVVTTGATVSEAARTLREAGAKEVYVACVASAADPARRTRSSSAPPARARRGKFPY